MIKFSIPGAFENTSINLALLELMEAHPEYFRDDVEIEAVFGNPQFCTWDGGRIFGDYHHDTLESIEAALLKFNKVFNIPVRYVFTSATLNENYFKDRFCNIMLMLGSQFKNQVVLVDDNLLNYIKENFPSYDFLSSTTKRLTSPKLAKAELDDDRFIRVCIDYDLNKNMKFLSSLTDEEKEKTEILVNAICPSGCPNRKEHYKLNSLSGINYGKKYGLTCAIKTSAFNPELITCGNNLTYNMIKESYEPLGFTHFKLEGRTWPASALAVTYAEYFAKEEYRNEVITTLMKNHCIIAGIGEQ